MEFLVEPQIRSIYGQMENNCGCPPEAVPIYGWPGGGGCPNKTVSI